MNRNVAALIALCTLVTTPVMGYWEYDATVVYISQPFSYIDPYGTWYAWWDGDGSYDYGLYFLEVAGYTQGGVGVCLSTDSAPDLERHMSVWSEINAETSFYRVDVNDPNDYREIDMQYTLEVTAADLVYQGFAYNRMGTYVTTSAAAKARCQAREGYDFWRYPGGGMYRQRSQQQHRFCREQPLGRNRYLG